MSRISTSGGVTVGSPADKTGSRSPSTVYQNTTGSAIFVSVTITSSEDGSSLGVELHYGDTSASVSKLYHQAQANVSNDDVDSLSHQTVQGLIPDGEFYLIEAEGGEFGGTFTLTWVEQKIS